MRSWVRNRSSLDLEKYFQALTRIREEYSGKLDVRIGVEMGLQPHLGETYTNVLRKAIPLTLSSDPCILCTEWIPITERSLREERTAEVYREAFRETLTCLDRVSSFDRTGASRLCGPLRKASGTGVFLPGILR